MFHLDTSVQILPKIGHQSLKREKYIYFWISYSTMKNQKQFIISCNLGFCRQRRDILRSWPAFLTFLLSGVMEGRLEAAPFEIFLSLMPSICWVFWTVISGFHLKLPLPLVTLTSIWETASVRSLTFSINSPVGDILMVTLHSLFFLCKMHFRQLTRFANIFLNTYILNTSSIHFL